MAPLAFDAVVSIVLAFFLLFLYGAALDSTYDVPLLSTFLFINGLLSLIGIIISLRFGSTLFMITFYFNIIFLSAAPLQQIANTWSNIYLDSELTLSAIGLYIISTIIGLITLLIRCSLANRLSDDRWSASLIPMIEAGGGSGLGRLLIILLPISIVLIALYSPMLFSSREAFGRHVGTIFSRELSIIVTSVLHPFIFISATIGLVLSARSGRLALSLGFLIAFMIAVLIYNPFIQARFRLSAMIVFLALVIYGWQSTRALFTFLISGTAISPILNSFRTLESTTDARTLTDFFSHMDYDAFTMTCYVIKYVLNEGVDYGVSAASAFLFFVPRALWPGKSDHVAKIMFDFLVAAFEAGTDNLSTPPVAEGFFAFGAIGSILATVLYFWMILSIERRALAAQPFSPAVLMASVAPMLVFILLRGPLIVGISELSGALVALVLCMWIIGAFSSMPQRRVLSSRPKFRSP